MHQQQGWPQAWEYGQAKLIQTLGRASQGVNWSWSQYIKSHHAQTSSGKELPSHFWDRDIVRSILPELRRKITGLAQWSKVLFFKLNTFCISFGNQGPRVWRKRGEAQNPCCLKSSVKFPQSVMIWAAMSSSGVGPLCFLKSTVICQDILEHFMLPSADKLYGDADFILQQDCPHCQRYQKLVQWAWCYCAWLASKLAWPEPNREYIGYCQEEDERHLTQQCRWAEVCYQSNLGFITPQQCHRLIVSMPRRIDAVIHARGDPTKYWVHRNKHNFQKPNISV